jgi:hypothetical protein
LYRDIDIAILEELGAVLFDHCIHHSLYLFIQDLQLYHWVRSRLTSKARPQNSAFQSIRTLDDSSHAAHTVEPNKLKSDISKTCFIVGSSSRTAPFFQILVIDVSWHHGRKVVIGDRRLLSFAFGCSELQMADLMP